MSPRVRGLPGLMVLALALGACKGRARPSHPDPEPGQIRVVEAEGATWYEHVDGPHFRDERGKGLIEAVEGHDPAVALARQARRMKLSGAILRLVAGATYVAAFLTWATTRHANNRDTENAAIFSLIGGGTALGITGAVLDRVGERRKWRSIASFNDWVLTAGYRDIPPDPGQEAEDPGPPPGAEDGVEDEAAEAVEAQETDAEADAKAEDAPKAEPEVAALPLYPRGLTP